MFGKKLKNTGFQPDGGLEMRHFEKTGENRQMVSGKKKLSFFPPTVYPSASSSRNHLAVGKRKEG